MCKGGPKMNAFLKRLVCGGLILCVLLVGCAAGVRTSQREELPVFAKEPTAARSELPCGLRQ